MELVLIKSTNVYSDRHLGRSVLCAEYVEDALGEKPIYIDVKLCESTKGNIEISKHSWRVAGSKRPRGGYYPALLRLSDIASPPCSKYMRFSIKIKKVIKYARFK